VTLLGLRCLDGDVIVVDGCPRRHTVSAIETDRRPDHRTATGMAAFMLLVDLVTRMLRANGDDRGPEFASVQVNICSHGIVDLIGCNPDMTWPDIDVQLDGLTVALALRPPAGWPGATGPGRQQL
jgi:hypothetical protein